MHLSIKPEQSLKYPSKVAEGTVGRWASEEPAPARDQLAL